jgi:hypothetical protein
MGVPVFPKSSGNSGKGIPVFSKTRTSGGVGIVDVHPLWVRMDWLRAIQVEVMGWNP